MRGVNAFIYIFLFLKQLFEKLDNLN